MLDDGEEEDDEWSDRSDRADRKKRSSSRLKKTAKLKKATKVRQDWVDGIDLKVFEIIAYWKSLREGVATVTAPPTHVQAIAGKRQVMTQNTIRGPTFNRPLAPVVDNNQFSPAETVREEWKKRPLIPSKRLHTRDYIFDSGESVDDTQPTTSSYVYQSSEPLAKKPRVVIYSGGQPQQFSTEYTRSTSNGFHFNGGQLRGGGRAQPVGDGMRRVAGGAPDTSGAVGDSGGDAQRFASYTVTNGNFDEQPPAIARFDTEEDMIGQGQSGHQQPVQRQVVYTGSAAPVSLRTPAGAGPGGNRLLMIRKSDGTTQYIKARDDQANAGNIQRIRSSGPGDQAVIVMGPNGQQMRRVVSTVASRPIIGKSSMGSVPQVVKYTPAGQKIVIPAASARMVSRPQVSEYGDGQNLLVQQQRIVRPAAAANSNVRRVQRVVTSRPGEQVYLAEEGPDDYGYSNDAYRNRAVPGHIARVRGGGVSGVSRPVPRIVSRGGVTMSVGQRLVQVGNNVDHVPYEDHDQYLDTYVDDRDVYLSNPDSQF